ncbi:hypothetical protein [Paraburkholderia rhizosphaerae]|uniref:Aspartyl protease n=1 Tax=Paraburkholderia rhizosphaerae TaxID=480658 RepID=A0A4R8LZA6_9BURK|nr:hypothetical protein [Paraburkholderia rhizosphaerae]TDY54001.1 hypothetical protein BX592_102148 [Paraburkholderia rhizosphaerae]
MAAYSSPRRAAPRASARIVALLSALMFSGCGTSITTPTPPASTAGLINGGRDGLLVPLHVERSDLGHARVGLPAQIDGKPVYLMFDTGTRGLRVLSSVLPRTAYPAAGVRTSLTFPTGAQASGPVVTVPFSMAGTKPVDIAAQSVDDVRCLPGAKRCVAMDGYTGELGWAFSGILGAAADAPDDTCCTPPLRALPARIGQRYLVHPDLTRPYLVLSPSNAVATGFTQLPLRVAQDGALQWPMGCVQVADKMRFWAPVVFATGGAGMIRIETDKAPSWLDDDVENKVLKQANYNVALAVGAWSHRFDGAQVTIAKAATGGNRIVIGLMALQNIDLLFDFTHAQLGVRAARDVETIDG